MRRASGTAVALAWRGIIKDVVAWSLSAATSRRPAVIGEKSPYGRNANRPTMSRIE